MGELESSKIQEKAKNIPHFYNVNVDPSLSGKNIIILEGDGEKKIGKPGKSDIQLYGIGWQYSSPLFSILLLTTLKYTRRYLISFLSLFWS